MKRYDLFWGKESLGRKFRLTMHVQMGLRLSAWTMLSCPQMFLSEFITNPCQVESLPVYLMLNNASFFF